MFGFCKIHRKNGDFMSISISEKVQDSASKAEYNRYKKIVEQIKQVTFDSLDNGEILDKSYELRDKISKGVAMDDIIIEAFALTAQAVKRALKLSPYDEQLIAGIAMHKGSLIEMQTGEGKTLAAVFPAFLNALEGLGCHILTFNDFLAWRDAKWMGPVFEMLGLTVGFVQENMKKSEKQRAYASDITYVTAKVAGFDYLMDSLCYKKSELMQRPFNFAIIDEADSVLIDEARIPLVIATGGEKEENVAQNRRLTDEVQASLEAKEYLSIQSKGRIMNQITLQGFILLYKKIAGMTSTAKDSSYEISEFYDLEVLVIPPHIPCKRVDYPDVIFTHKEAKYKALSAEIKKVHATGQPILIGTCSEEESEYLAEELNILGIEYKVLNAKNDELEALIIEQAGSLHSVTIATNMAGRGVDIKLGGVDGSNRDKIVALGGLYIIGTSRHESIRIDNQLRGRMGTMGDASMSRFFISLEDDLIKRYGIDKLITKVLRSGKQEEPLINPKIAKKIGQVQRIIQGQDSDLRRALWQYAFFIEKQRIQVHQRRMEIVNDSIPFNILGKENPELFIKLTNFFNEGTITELEKQVALYNIDEVWADYLAHVEELQESVKLSVLKGKNPIIEYQMETDNTFQKLALEVQNRIMQEFEVLEISQQGLNILKERVKPPSSTRTYLVHDNSLMGPLSSLFIANTISIIGKFLAWPIIIVTSVYKKIFSKAPTTDNF
jgi:preprotein translocase subunit SecA